MSFSSRAPWVMQLRLDLGHVAVLLESVHLLRGDGAVHDLLQPAGGLGVGIDLGEIIDEAVVFPPVLPGVLAVAEDPDRVDGVEIDGVPVLHPVGHVAALAGAHLAEDFPRGHRFPLGAGAVHRTADMVLPRRRPRKDRQQDQGRSQIFPSSVHGRKVRNSGGFLQNSRHFFNLRSKCTLAPWTISMQGGWNPSAK